MLLRYPKGMLQWYFTKVCYNGMLLRYTNGMILRYSKGMILRYPKGMLEKTSQRYVTDRGTVLR